MQHLLNWRTRCLLMGCRWRPPPGRRTWDVWMQEIRGHVRIQDTMWDVMTWLMAWDMVIRERTRHVRIHDNMWPADSGYDGRCGILKVTCDLQIWQVVLDMMWYICIQEVMRSAGSGYDAWGVNPGDDACCWSDMCPGSDMGQVDPSNKAWWVERKLHWQSPQYPVNVLISWPTPWPLSGVRWGKCKGFRNNGKLSDSQKARTGAVEGSLENCLLCSQLTVNVAQKRGHCGRYWLFRSLRPEEG